MIRNVDFANIKIVLRTFMCVNLYVKYIECSAAKKNRLYHVTIRNSHSLFFPGQK